MYQAGMLSRRREGTQVFYKVADQMFIELCRTVSTQIATRTGLGVTGLAFSAGASISGQLAAEPPLSKSPSNQKEPASV
jgi:hypothetical protein